VVAGDLRPAAVSIALLLPLLMVCLASCGISTGGGKVTRIGNQEPESEDFCNWGCAEFAPNGRCVRFTDDISDVCARYLDRGKPSPAVYAAPAISSLCNAPGGQGKYWEVEATGKGDVNLTLFNKEPGIGGEDKVRFSKGEWEGVQRVLREHQAPDNANYRRCVMTLTPLFINRTSRDK